LADLAQEVIVIDSEHYGRVEDAHMGICHMICYAFMENPGIAGEVQSPRSSSAPL
jgi:D-sedoheptulose 7-phosphate isomerase